MSEDKIEFKTIGPKSKIVYLNGKKVGELTKGGEVNKGWDIVRRHSEWVGSINIDGETLYLGRTEKVSELKPKIARLIRSHHISKQSMKESMNEEMVEAPHGDPHYHANVHRELINRASGPQKEISLGAHIYRHLSTHPDESHITSHYEKTIYPILKKHGFPREDHGPVGPGHPRHDEHLRFHREFLPDVHKAWRDMDKNNPHTAKLLSIADKEAKRKIAEREAEKEAKRQKGIEANKKRMNEETQWVKDKHGSGYTTSDGKREIVKHPKGWISRSTTDKHDYSDVYPTQREAKAGKYAWAMKNEEHRINEAHQWAIATPTKKGGWRRVPDTRFNDQNSAHAYGKKYHTSSIFGPQYKVIPHPDNLKEESMNEEHRITETNPGGEKTRYAVRKHGKSGKPIGQPTIFTTRRGAEEHIARLQKEDVMGGVPTNNMSSGAVADPKNKLLFKKPIKRFKSFTEQ
jgi:hypothetical protein